MKLKKCLLFLITILIGCSGLLFGCNEKPLRLSIYYKEEVVEEITLNLPTKLTNLEKEETLDNLGKSVNIYVHAENVNDMFKSGLFVNYNKNIVKVDYVQDYENAYEYKITALKPENTIVTFETKDKKISTKLNINILEDCEKIESNVQTANYIVLGEDKVLSNTMLTFTPTTTTNKEITYSFTNNVNYEGIILEEGIIKFIDKNNPQITLNGEKVDNIAITCTHKNYESAQEEDKNNYVVENILFDIITPINELVTLKNETPISELEFASNVPNFDVLNFANLDIKQKVFSGNEDIDDSYELQYYLEVNDDLVIVDNNKSDKFALTVSQNFRSGTNTLIIKAVNKIQPSYQSKEIRISIIVKTYPTYISVNGEKNPEEIVLYDNGLNKELNVVVGIEGSYNTNFKVDMAFDSANLNLKFVNGQDVPLGTDISSNTKLLLSSIKNISNEISTRITFIACGNENVKTNINIRIVKNLTDVDFGYDKTVVKFDNLTNEYSVSKLDTLGSLITTKFTIEPKDSIYVPNFSVVLSKENIVSLEKITYTLGEKSFTIKTLTSGKVTISLVFDNGLEKDLVLNVYVPVKDIVVDLDQTTRDKSLGKIEETAGEISYFVIKQGYTAQLLIKPYDVNNNLILDYSIISTVYELKDNDANIAINNTTNIINALKETTNDVTVTVKLSVYNQVGDLVIISKTFKVGVYINVTGINILNDNEITDYVTLYSRDSLGYDDYNLSSATLVLNIKPINANKIQIPISYQANFNVKNVSVKVNDTEITQISQTGKVYKDAVDNLFKIKVEAIRLDDTTVEIGTITFSIQEYNITYSRKVTIKVTKAEQPTGVLVENVSVIEDNNGNKENYLYFNLGIDEEININPKVYPTNSYNLECMAIIENQSTGNDPILYRGGVVIPLEAGECDLVLVPKGVLTYNTATNKYEYNENACKRIKILVADGDIVPYNIKTKEDLLKLCTSNEYNTTSDNLTNFKNIQEAKYTKKYVLTNDIDLTGETIFPIGAYSVDVKYPSFHDVIKNVVPFTGEFNGKFTINSVEKQYSITGISINANREFINSVNINDILDNKTKTYLGLFAINSGVIKNLNVIYLNITGNVTGVDDLSKTQNQKHNLYFGGVSAINKNVIENCNINIYNANIKTYLCDNYIGGISAINSKNITNCYILGNLNIINGYNDDFNNIYVGGISADNQSGANITGSYRINENEIFNKSNINSTLNITGLDINGVITKANNTAYGLVSGLNSGVIDKMSSYGKIYAYNNLGGIVGINKGSILNSYTFSSLFGNSNVGGLIGSSTSGDVKNNAVILLDDNDYFKVNDNISKIIGHKFVAGLVGSEINTTTLSNNYIRSFIDKSANYFDVITNDNCYPIYVNDGVIDLENAIKSANFADNLKISYADGENKTDLIKGKIDGLGLVAPTSIKAILKDSTLTEDSILGYNKFIKCDNDTLILYYYKNSNIKYNEFLRNLVFKLNYIYDLDNDGIDDTNILESQKGKINKIESDNTLVLSVDEKGNFTIHNSGEVNLTIYSLLNKNAKAQIKIKIINAVDVVNVYEDSLLTKVINNNLIVKKDSSVNIYLNESLKQKDIFVEYLFDGKNISVNDNNIDNLYSVLDSQVIKGLEIGTTNLTIKFKVKFGENYYYLPNSLNFNVIVSSGLKNFYSDITSARITKNAYLDLNLEVETDLINSTNIVVEQFGKISETSVEPVSGEFLNYVLDTNKTADTINYNLKLRAKDNIKENIIVLKVYITDNFTSLEDIKNNIDLYNNYYKEITINIEDSSLIDAELEYYADGEKVKNSLGEDVYNGDELPSEFIKIGKVGILKINVNQIDNINEDTKFTLTYTNSDNLNLTLKQVKKVSDGYEDISTDKVISNGLELDSRNYLFNNSVEGNYLYVKLLTDSGIKENSQFILKLTISGFDYYFSKTLTSKLSSNLELSYNGAILNSNEELEGVYAKGVENQIISLTVNKLNAYEIKKQFINCDYATLNLLQTTILGDDSVRYDYTISNLTTNATIKLYFYIDKTVNGKTERYLTKTLKLNVVDFVITGVSLLNVNDGYLTKPIGTSYPLIIKLDTINNGSTEILNKISELENKISRENIFKFNNEKLLEKTYDNFEVYKTSNYYIKPLNVVRTTGFNMNFNVSYKNDIENNLTENEITIEELTKYHFDSNNNYTINLNANFGVNFYIQTDINNPVPVYNQEEFESMSENANYIMLNDIILENYTPLTANFNSLDGNGYSVIIRSLNIDLESVIDSYNFGVFSELSENSTIKNLTVKYNFKYADNNVVENQRLMNFKNIQNLYFGGLVGINNGLIYNCKVENFSRYGENTLEPLNIQVTNILNGEQTKAYIGGIVSQNNGIITNSRSELKLSVNKGYISGFVCQNNGTISSSYYNNASIKNAGEDETTSVTAGFVVFNSGKILYSYSQGEILNSNGNYVSSISSNYCLTSPTSIGGFVYNNTGNIEDCYSNLSITSNSYSGGFVYTNSGTITRSYSACLNSRSNNIAHAPFIATRVEINKEQMQTKIKNCFYLKNENTSTINDDYVTGLTLDEFNNEYYLTNFVLDNKTIWELCENCMPKLYEANNVAISQRRLYSASENQDGSIIYSYVYTEYYAGHELNPITISSEEEFLSYFSLKNDRNTYSYRLINNIDFSEFSNLPTSEYVFSGKLDGNGLEINNMSISAESGFNKDTFGLFSSIEGTDENASVKNLIIKPLEVYANNIKMVGTLAGYAENANLVNIKVDAEGVIVQGKNIVGGIVGLIKGNCNIVNLESNISVNANYNNISGLLTGKYLYNENDSNDKISYAGGIIGVADLNKTTVNNERVRNIVVNNSVKTIAEFSGFAFGLICENSGVDNVKVNINASSYINASYSAGYIAGENRGYINRAETIDNNIGDAKIIRNSPRSVGGIVGFNNGGVVTNSLSRVNIITNSGLVAGGIAGLTCGGSFSSNVVTGKVKSLNISGGVIGYATRKEILKNIQADSILNADETVKSNNIVFISNAVVFADIETNGGYNGGIIGAVHNTMTKDDGEISTTIKNSFITYNNYYKKQENLKDFGAYNCASYYKDNAPINENIEEEKYCGKEITSLTENVFANFSKGVFDLTNINSIELLPLNNINTKKLVGDGSLNNPYLLDSVRGINELAEIVNGGNRKIYINLIDNIEATGKEINSIGDAFNSFTGTFNGNNKIINGYTYLNKELNYTQNYFGVFGFVGEGGIVKNLNVSANFVINYGANTNYTGIIAGYNRGYISNCNVYGGIIGVLQNVNAEYALTYVGGIAGLNSGRVGYGIVDSNNYATIYVTIQDEEISKGAIVKNVTIYAGLISGANIGGASITRSTNLAKSLALNGGAKDYVLIVKNGLTNCNTYANEICGSGYNKEQNRDVVYSNI